jgi:hypothetical protein
MDSLNNNSSPMLYWMYIVFQTPERWEQSSSKMSKISCSGFPAIRSFILITYIHYQGGGFTPIIPEPELYALSPLTLHSRPNSFDPAARLRR